jgi:hypothetical protein
VDVDAVWEQWDLACTDPGGCDALDQLLRVMVWSYLFIALIIFYAAVRPWTRQLPTTIGAAVSAAAAFVIVWLARNVVASSGNLRTAGIITALGLLAVWIGRPAFTERRRDPPITEESPPISSTQ